MTGATSCTSMRPVAAVSAPTAPKEYRDIKPNDVVFVEMSDGRRHTFKVKSVEDEALTSIRGQRYARAQMRELRRERFSHKLTWWTVGIAAATVWILYGIAAAAGGIMSS